MSYRKAGGIVRGENEIMGTNEGGDKETRRRGDAEKDVGSPVSWSPLLLVPLSICFGRSAPRRRRRGLGRRSACGGFFAVAFAVATFQHALTDVLRGRFDLLHLLADPGAGGLVAAFGLADVLFRLAYEPL